MKKERRLSINKKFKSSTFKIGLSVSQNNKPYLSIINIDNNTFEDSSIGIPLTESDAKKLYKWLNSYLYPYAPENE